ncbi:MAG TPA: hypothetical protein VFI22_10125, partial [Thermomicrobiales bacterium]|nr:hypothetical protein [Thermomicrobiales bacterium]
AALSRPLARPTDAPPTIGDFARRRLSRRRAMQAASAMTLVGAGLGRWPRAAAQTAGANPRPIPGGLDFGGTLLHVYLPSPGAEPATIVDFRGLVGIVHVQGEGTVTRGGGGAGTPTAIGERLVYDADMRFMQGVYIGEDGKEHDGNFAFV